jgi:hypothetical protein
LKKEFVVMQISAMKDGSPNVVLTLVEERMVRLEDENRCDLPYPYRYQRYIDQDYCTTTVVDLNEYASSGLKVGDMVTVELKKSTERKLGFSRSAEQPTRDTSRGTA